LISCCFKVAVPVLGQAGVYLGQDLGEFALGVELLQLRPPGGHARMRGWLHDLYHEWRSFVSKYINALPEVDCDRYFY